MTRKHLLLMAICCTVPIMALAAIFLFQIQISAVLLLGLILLCPALHLWMMRRHIGYSNHAPEQSNSRASSDNINSRQTVAIRE
jgi:ABC-type transport system involved in cytochrome bd biosynthesis fused ATPase/permease subunit